MINVEEIRRDFPMLSNTMQGKPLIYLDNAATTFKPKCVIDAVTSYYTTFNANCHRGDYDLSHDVDVAYEEVRSKVGKFINCLDKEVVFTSGASASLNIVANGVGQWLKQGDEILLNEAEHASNILPWFMVAQATGAIIKYIPLNKEGRLTVENLKNTITEKTKVVSLAHVTNVLAYTIDIKEICKVAHEYGALVVVDGAQSIAHMKVDVKDLDCDFYCFSAHKMLGPTGVGVLYGKYDLLDKMNPLMMGGGMNSRFYSCGSYSLLHAPRKFEAGTPNIEGVIGFGAAIDYLSKIGMENIHEYEHNLKQYAISKLKEIPNIVIYNETNESGVITFNNKNVFAQDLATHFNSYGIAVRAGQHCAKILMNFLGTVATVRASISFYNTKEEIDKFIEVCKKGDEYLDAFFK